VTKNLQSINALFINLPGEIFKSSTGLLIQYMATAHLFHGTLFKSLGSELPPLPQKSPLPDGDVQPLCDERGDTGAAC
jgi:hypothetical protein